MENISGIRTRCTCVPGKSLLKQFVIFAPKTFRISTTCLLWRETFFIILPRAEARGYHIVAPTYYFLKAISLTCEHQTSLVSEVSFSVEIGAIESEVESSW